MIEHDDVEETDLSLYRARKTMQKNHKEMQLFWNKPTILQAVKEFFVSS